MKLSQQLQSTTGRAPRSLHQVPTWDHVQPTQAAQRTGQQADHCVGTHVPQQVCAGDSVLHA